MAQDNKKVSEALLDEYAAAARTLLATINEKDQHPTVAKDAALAYNALLERHPETITLVNVLIGNDK